MVSNGRAFGPGLWVGPAVGPVLLGQTRQMWGASDVELSQKPDRLKPGLKQLRYPVDYRFTPWWSMLNHKNVLIADLAVIVYAN